MCTHYTVTINKLIVYLTFNLDFHIYTFFFLKNPYLHINIYNMCNIGIKGNEYVLLEHALHMNVPPLIFTTLS